jgi:hypothetical protein
MPLSSRCKLDVALRWAELESIFSARKPWEKKTPKKFLLRSLRKSHKRPGCEMYACHDRGYPGGPCFWQLGSWLGEPARWQRVYVNGSESPRYTFPVYEENPHQSSASAAAGWRGSTPKSNSQHKPDLHECEIVEVDDEGNEIVDVVSEGPVKDETPRLRPLSENEFYTPPQKVRERNRSVKNDEYLKGKICELRKHVSNVKARARHSEEKAKTSESRIADLEAQIQKLQSQFSKIDLTDPKYFGGVAVPPPEGLYGPPRWERTTAGRSTGRFPRRTGERAGPVLRPGTSKRVDMKTGNFYVVCSLCRASLALDGECSTPKCPGLPPQPRAHR